MSEPSAYEIAEAWEDLDDAVRQYRRASHDYNASDRVERRFRDFARLLDRVKEPT